MAEAVAVVRYGSGSNSDSCSTVKYVILTLIVIRFFFQLGLEYYDGEEDEE